jgi:DNA topoisomerase-1
MQFIWQLTLTGRRSNLPAPGGRDCAEAAREAHFRVMFNEITKRAVNEAFEHPRKIDEKLVNSNRRRVLDRLVGYKVSPLLCRTIGGRLSAGRVQSVALRMVVEREREIEKFIKTEYWTIGQISPPTFPGLRRPLFKVDAQTVKTAGFDQPTKANEILINDEAKATEIVAEANQQAFVVNEVTKKERKRNPVPPFHYLKAATRGGAQTRLCRETHDDDCAETLRGRELGAEGSVGLITYMRTTPPGFRMRR